MLAWLTRQIRFSQLNHHWHAHVGLRLDQHRLGRQASDLMQAHGIRAEDAWLGALVHWAYACPDQQIRVGIARGITGFVQDNQRFAFEEEAQTAALTIARQILNEG